MLQSVQNMPGPAADPLLLGKHYSKHLCFILTAAQEHLSLMQLTIPECNTLHFCCKQRPFKCYSHALSHEVAAHVVTIQMQLRVQVFYPNRRIGSGLPHPTFSTSLVMMKHQQQCAH